MLTTTGRPEPRPDPGTLTQLFFKAVEQFDKPDALQYKAGGTYRPISHRDVVRRVRHLGLGLRALGVRPATAWRSSPRTAPNGRSPTLPA